MSKNLTKSRVNINRGCALDIYVWRNERLVVTNLVTTREKPILVYAERFDKPCNYLKIGIRHGIEYLNSERCKIAMEKSAVNEGDVRS